MVPLASEAADLARAAGLNVSVLRSLYTPNPSHPLHIAFSK